MKQRSLDLAGTETVAASVSLCEMLTQLANALATAVEATVSRNARRSTFISQLSFVSGQLDEISSPHRGDVGISGTL